MTECRWCGNKFQPCKNSQKYCDECRSDPEVERARERKRKQLEREKKANKRNDRQKKEKRCLYCNKKLDPSSNRQVWCEKCRINGYRDTRAMYMRKWRKAPGSRVPSPRNGLDENGQKPNPGSLTG